ncbi:MAG: FAD-binding protein [Burkholderiaceae bacterium]
MAQHHIVVIGHGAAGLSAALTAAQSAHERGASVKITVIERASATQWGGNSRWSPSYIRMRTSEAMDPSFVDEIMLQSGGRADRAYFDNLAAQAPATARWLQEQGVVFHQPPYYLARGPARIQPIGGGVALIEALYRQAKAAGVDFRYGCKLHSLQLKAGRICGVALGSGAETLDCDTVVLACGGFQGHVELLNQHFGPGADQFRLIAPGTVFNDGSGIAAALQIGAQASGDWRGMHAEPVDARSTASAPIVLVYPYGIVVNQQGQRFFDEGAGLVHETWETFARALHCSLPGRQAYAILDAKLFDIADYARAIRSEVAPLQANSLNELADQLGIERTCLSATVDAYNASCPPDCSGFDATQKDGLACAPALHPTKSNWARPLVQAPFLAWPLVGALAYTFGGIQTDIQARVLGAEGPIHGLYAAGEITGHFYGTAPNAVAMLRALVYGRIAGDHAVSAL